MTQVNSMKKCARLGRAVNQEPPFVKTNMESNEEMTRYTKSMD